MNKILTILSELEKYRKMLNAKPAQAGPPDHLIRVCEAIVATGEYLNRASWIRELEEEKL